MRQMPCAGRQEPPPEVLPRPGAQPVNVTARYPDRDDVRCLVHYRPDDQAVPDGKVPGPQEPEDDDRGARAGEQDGPGGTQHSLVTKVLTHGDLVEERQR